ncbi:MAG: DUF2924 domain-containing protein [Terracidiphilus sp.]
MSLNLAIQPTLDQQLAALPGMERKALQALWHRLFGKPPNHSLRREVLIPILAYRLQEVTCGGINVSAVEKRLRDLTLGGPSSRQNNLLLRPKPGTHFVREWQGKLHEVTVLPDSYEYNDHTYGSLSEIARLITGTRWSGPAFFGLHRRAKERAA